MLLRRIEQHIRDQNWFAVALDFLIVVVGVYFGIQLGNWNDARNDGARQIRVLERLHEEAEMAVGYFDDVSDTYTRLNTNRLRVVNAIVTDDWTDWGELKEWEVGSMFSSNSYLPTPSPRRSALDEFLNGDLYSNLQDNALRLAIDDYSTRLSWLIGQTEYVRQFKFDPLAYDGVWIELHPFYKRDAGFRADTDRLGNNPTLISDLLRNHRFAKSMEFYWNDVEDVAQKLCEETGRALGKSCVPGGDWDEDEPSESDEPQNPIDTSE